MICMRLLLALPVVAQCLPQSLALCSSIRYNHQPVRFAALADNRIDQVINAIGRLAGFGVVA